MQYVLTKGRTVRVNWPSRLARTFSWPRATLRKPAAARTKKTLAPAVDRDARGSESADAVEWFLKGRVGDGATELPADVYAAAREHIARMPRHPVAGGTAPRGASAATHAWTSLGPGTFGGRTR